MFYSARLLQFCYGDMTVTLVLERRRRYNSFIAASPLQKGVYAHICRHTTLAIDILQRHVQSLARDTQRNAADPRLTLTPT